MIICLWVDVPKCIPGVEITEYFSLSFRKVLEKSTCLALFLPLLDCQTDSYLQKFSLSFSKVAKIFTCLGLFFPVPDMRTSCNFHPCVLRLMSSVNIMSILHVQ